ncbi:Bug family tripartite tricarboxylate transporter substrate binding protein [Parasedimentitalea psychrophila]|uniref:Tripartite tricarboxylate transporter substrate binding protein n=1 Tax=Parasedimentitalea psychrophila TaxID=2997337 RepID=A0A9Y2P803_9RHOB|nr:tripartite tricarboxylate transporter substrate binding protein [Parasedimentitalea psychrophila]WIY26568.1 tripartite tricarboxylate transporter substrate binding protein [Parasedimentitalea psychrophila]
MKNFLKTTQSILSAAALVAPATMMFATASTAQDGDYPSKPMELVCTTSPGSGTAVWCEMLAVELAKDDYLGVPIKVTYMNGGSNHEPTVYLSDQAADGYTFMHMSRSFTSYFNLPHFTKTPDDFHLLAKFEETVYGVGVRCDDPDISSWDDLVAYNEANPGELAMGSNKVGSTHHLQHTMIGLDPAGADMRFVPYKGTGEVVKDVVGGHLRVGFAQPGRWNTHIEAGTICPILILNEERLDHPLWAEVPSIREAGMSYDVPHQWQGFMVKAGTPPERMDILAAAMEKVTTSDQYRNVYMAQNPHVVPAFDAADRDKLMADFKTAVGVTREFLLEIGMIEGS